MLLLLPSHARQQQQLTGKCYLEYAECPPPPADSQSECRRSDPGVQTANSGATSKALVKSQDNRPPLVLHGPCQSFHHNTQPSQLCYVPPRAVHCPLLFAAVAETVFPNLSTQFLWFIISVDSLTPSTKRSKNVSPCAFAVHRYIAVSQCCSSSSLQNNEEDKFRDVF